MSSLIVTTNFLILLLLVRVSPQVPLRCAGLPPKLQFNFTDKPMSMFKPAMPSCKNSSAVSMQCFKEIITNCMSMNESNKVTNLNTSSSNPCAVNLARDVAEVCSMLQNSTSTSSTSSCINSFLGYAAGNSNFTTDMNQEVVYSTALQSLLRNCLESSIADEVTCVMNAITTCQKQQKQAGSTALSMCFKIVSNICSVVSNLEPDDCDFYIDSIANDYSRIACADNITLCRGYIAELMKNPGAVQGAAGKIGRSIHGKIRDDDRHTEEALEDYTQAIAFLDDQQSSLFGDFDNDDAMTFINVTDMFMESSRVDYLLLTNMSATAGPDILEGLQDLSRILAGSVLSREGQVMQKLSYTGKNLNFNMQAISQQSLNYSYQANSNGTAVSIIIPTMAVCSVDNGSLGQNTRSSGGKCHEAVFERGCKVMITSSVSFNLDSLFVLGTNSYIISPIFSSQLITNDTMVGQVSTMLAANATMKITLENVENLMGGNGTNVSCVFWNKTLQSWSTEGVTTTVIASNEVECSSTHLTSFAILIDHAGVIDNNSTAITTGELLALNVLGYIGPCVSIVCLVLTIILLIVFRKQINKGSLLYIHLNFSFSLLLALVVLVAGIETATKIKWLCGVIAGLLHYLFLCVFCWMLAEGIMLYILLVRVFGRLADKWYFLLLFSWGFPIPIVAVSAGIRSMLYGTSQACWLSPQYGMRWSLIGPMIAIILVNTVFLVLTIIHLVRGRKIGGAEQNVKTYDLIKTAVKATIILLPLLGITWIIGVFALDSRTTVFLWLFTILNSLQGLAIFYLHVLRNEVITRWLRGRVQRVLPLKQNKELKKNGDLHVNTLTLQHSNTSMESTMPA